MEEKINIAEILKDKPQGTILYDYLHNIDVEFDNVETTEIETSIWCTRDKGGYNELFGYSKLGTLRGWLDGLQILLPSKEMRDWSKFAWKKGDVMVNNKDRDIHVVFEKFTDDTYTTFTGKYYRSKISKNGYESVRECSCATEEFTLEAENAAQTYIKTIEEKLGGKLNRDTLEIEQPEFNDGDIVVSNSGSIVLVKEIKCGERVYYHACMINGNVYVKGTEDEYYGIVSDIDRLATDTEKLQFFEALAKKGKRWDVGKKQIVDLKPKCEFKPFDKVLGRNEKDDVWEAELFSHYREESQYPFRCIGFSRKYCIPYNEKTAHLLGTTDDWEGGEQ